MNKDEALRMAREANAYASHQTGDSFDWQGIRDERFAALVAAAEREACAKLCDEIAIDMWNLYKGRTPYKGDEEGRASDFTQGRSAGADDCAEAIRKRNNT